MNKNRRFGRKPYGGGMFVVFDKARAVLLRENDFGPDRGVLIAGNETATVYSSHTDCLRAIEFSQEYAERNRINTWRAGDYLIVELFQNFRAPKRRTSKRLNQGNPNYTPY